VFGRESRSAAEIIQTTMSAAAGQIPPAPWPFRFTPGKGVEMEITDKNGNSDWVTIFEYDMRPIKRVYSESAQREVTIWETNNPADGFVRIEMPAASLYDKRQFQQVLADNGVYCDLSQIDNMRRYMVSYTQELQKVFRKEMLYARMGWRDNYTAFVYADKLYTRDSVQPCEVERHSRVSDAIHQSGDLEAWKKIVDHFSRPAFVGHQFAIGTAFGSVLMPFTGVSGGIINLIGESGEGKSTVQKIVNSVWGHPQKLMLPAESRSSTYNAKISFINQMHSLPICAEEITGATPEELGALAYAITQGTEKWRADITGKVRESLGGWCTTMLTSSNMPIHDRLHSTDGAEAKALRVFEYRIYRVAHYTKTQFREGVDIPLMNNYGLVGPLYIQHVCANLESIKQRIAEMMRHLDESLKLRPEERVWAAVISTNLVGLEIAYQLGFHSFDVSKIRMFVGECVDRMRASVKDIVSTPADRIGEFLSHSLSATLVVDTQKSATFVVSKPSRGLDVRYDIGTHELHISISALRTWAKSVGISPTKLVNDLVTAGLVKVRSTRMRLGADADIPSAQVRVIVLDASAPAFSSAIRHVTNPLNVVRTVQ